MIVLTKRTGIQILVIAGAGLAMTAMLLPSRAQAQETESKSAASNPEAAKPETEQVQTFFLKNVTETRDLNEVTTEMRNVMSRAKIYQVASQNAITIRATPEDLQTAQKLLADIDQPKKVYRVTFTITQSDGGKKIGSQHYSLVVTGDSKSSFKQGNRIPIVTGTFDKDSSGPSTQIQYQDVGVNIEAVLTGVGLRTKIEQTSVSDEKSNVGIQDPVVRQTTLEGMSTFVPGKSVALGSMDIPGTMQHQDIELVAELVP